MSPAACLVRPLLLAAGLVGLLLPGRVAAQDHAVAVGITMTGGIIGVESVHHVRGAPLGFAVGLGYRGLGVRGQFRAPERDFGEGGWQAYYLSAGVTVNPLLDGDEAPLLVFVEGGFQGALAYRGYVDLGVGAFVPVGGTFNSYALGPALHLTVGLAY